MNRNFAFIIILWSFCVSYGGQVFSNPLKNSPVEVSLSDYIDTEGRQGLVVDTRILNTLSQEIAKSENGGSVAQIRIYQQDDGGVKREILQNRYPILLSLPVDEFVLEPNLVCNSTGTKTLFVWTSIRFNRANYPRNEAYENNEARFSYECVNKSDRTRIEMVSPPNLDINLDRMQDSGQIPMSLNFNADQFRSIKNLSRLVQLKLFVVRDVADFQSNKSKVVRLPVGRVHQVQSSKPVDYSIPLKSLCDEVAIYWNDIYSKMISLTCEIAIVHDADSSRDFKFETYACPNWEIICPAK